MAREFREKCGSFRQARGSSDVGSPRGAPGRLVGFAGEWSLTGRAFVIPIVLLLASAVAIYIACEWFLNAVEWLGLRLKVGPLAVGTVLAAVGTALPESAVTGVAAILGHTPAEKAI